MNEAGGARLMLRNPTSLRGWTGGGELGVREEDRHRTWNAARPLTGRADRALARHVQQGRTNQIAVTLRFAETPPIRVRRELRERWNLSWEGALECWPSVVADAANMEGMRMLAAAHSGWVEKS